MMKRIGWGAAYVLVAVAVGCNSKTDAGGSGDGDDPRGGAGGMSGDGDGDGDGDGSVSAKAESGERLQLRMWRGSGIEWVESVYDAELDAPCAFVTATDGTLRCFPTNESLTAGVQVVFKDEDCSEAIGRTWEGSCPEVGRYTRVEVPGDCYPRQMVSYKVGDEIELPEVIYERDYQGNCRATDLDGTGYELTLVPLDDLATVTTEVAPRASGFGTQLYVSEDGLRYPVSPYDVEADFPCNFQTIGGGTSRREVCLGPIAYTDSSGHYGYSDAACEALAAGSTQCGVPAYIMAYSQVGECWATKVYEVGRKLDKAYLNTDEMCAETEESYYHAFYAVGEALDEELIPELERSRVGDTRLVRETYESDGAAFYESNSIWDASLKQYCYPRVIDGRTYCLPSSTLEMSADGSWFADPACTEVLNYYMDSPCTETSAARYTMIGIWSEQSACGASALDALYSAEIYEDDIVYVLNPDGDCVTEPAVEDATYVKAGDPIDPSEELVELTLRD